MLVVALLLTQAFTPAMSDARSKIDALAAIVSAPRPFALVILVRGLPDAKEGSRVAAEITRVLYDASQTSGRP